MNGFQVNVGIWRRCGIEQEGGPVDARRNLLEQLQPLAGNRRLHNGETSGVAAWPRKALYEAAADRIGNDNKHDGNSPRLLQHCRGWRCVLRNDEVGLQRDEFDCGSLPYLRVIERPPAKVELDIAAFRPPELLKSLPECAHVSLKFRVALGMRHQHADVPHAVRLLRTRCEGPCRRRTADKRDEFAPSHFPEAPDKTP